MSILVFLFIVCLRFRFQRYELGKNRNAAAFVIHLHSFKSKLTGKGDPHGLSLPTRVVLVHSEKVCPVFPFLKVQFFRKPRLANID